MKNIHALRNLTVLSARTARNCTLLATFILGSAAAYAVDLNIGPVDPGAATVTQVPNTSTTINQSAVNAIYNCFDSCSTAAGYTLQFITPGATSISYIRASGGATTWLGTLLSNGQVWFSNADGIMVGNGAVMNVAGLLLSTSGFSDGAFAAGNASGTYTSDLAPTPGAGIVVDGALLYAHGVNPGTADLTAFFAAYNSSIGDPNYDPFYDFDHDGTIDTSDYAVARSMGQGFGSIGIVAEGIQITGGAHVHGDESVHLTAGTLPQVTMWGDGTGIFSIQATQPVVQLPPGMAHAIEISGAGTRVTAGPGNRPGGIHSADFDGDGDVDVSDLQVFRAQFGVCSVGCSGDFDHDGDVDLDDYQKFRTQFGLTADPAGIVPNPNIQINGLIQEAALAGPAFAVNIGGLDYFQVIDPTRDINASNPQGVVVTPRPNVNISFIPAGGPIGPGTGNLGNSDNPLPDEGFLDEPPISDFNQNINDPDFDPFQGPIGEPGALSLSGEGGAGGGETNIAALEPAAGPGAKAPKKTGDSNTDCANNALADKSFNAEECQVSGGGEENPQQ